MVRLISIICIVGSLWGIFLSPVQATLSERVGANKSEVGVYQFPETPLHFHLDFDYAQPEILNPDVFDVSISNKIHRIELVFTRYPYHFEDWRTDYDWLLEQRLKALYGMDSSIFLRDDIEWEFILQTGCKTEPEAMEFYHGLIIYYHPEAYWHEPTDTIKKLSIKHPFLDEITQIVYQEQIRLRDSAVYKIFDRHPEWEGSTVVMDWTASMYHNGASVLRWYRQNLKESALKHLFIFNDGNRKCQDLKMIGKTGGIYYAEPKNIERVLLMMLKARLGGLGGDPPENDVEALLKASFRKPDFNELILIPDRNSSVRDIRLLGYLRVPVRIVLFSGGYVESAVGLGAKDNKGKKREDHWIHPHYLSLASMTGGSIHTAQWDIENLSKLPEGKRIRIGTYVYEKSESGMFKPISQSE